MNWDQVKGEWKQMKGKARQEWAALTEDDLNKAAGDRQQFEGLLQSKYRKGKEDARRAVDAWLAKQT